MGKATPQDTATMFIGSGALDWSWWLVTEAHGAFEMESPDDWHLTLAEFDPDDDRETGTRKRIDHAAIMRAVNKLARTRRDNPPAYLRRDVLAECSTFLRDPDDADFDADAADQVLQYIMFGRVVYG